MKRINISGRLAAAAVLFCLALPGHGQSVRFERFVPALQQPWYFADGIDGIAVDGDRIFAVSEGNAYVLSRTGRVVTLASPPFVNNAQGLARRDGSLYVPTFGGVARYDDNFQFQQLLAAPAGSAGEINLANDVQLLDDGGFVVLDVDFSVVDGSANRVLFFDADFSLTSQFSGLATCSGGFARPQAGLSVAPDGSIYVADQCNHKIQQFSEKGELLREFGSLADSLSPQDLIFSFDEQSILVVGSDDISVFNLDGTLARKFAPPASGSNFFLSIEKAPDGTYLVGSISAIHRFTDGSFKHIASFQAAGTGTGFFDEPSDIATDPLTGEILMPEFRNNRVSVLDGQGNVLRYYDTSVNRFETLDSPSSISSLGQIQLMINGNTDYFFAVADCPGVKFFDSSGNTYSPIVTPSGSAPGEFEQRCGKNVGTIDGLEFYLTDRPTQRVIVYNTLFTFVREWVSTNAALQPVTIDSLTTDGSALIALSSGLVIFYNEDGTVLKEFPVPTASDIYHTADGTLLLASRNALLRYDTDGNLLVTTPIERGIGPGQIRNTADWHAADLGTDQIIAADTANHRVQYFRTQVTTDNPKAIIVAGGGPYPGNALWDATRINANFAYRTLLNQGFDKTAVQYISDDIGVDLDQNGAADDVDAAATRAAVQDAITGAFADDATELVLYLVDHGGDNTFRLSQSQTMTATELGGWLDDWQAAHPGARVTIVYDACQSGSFIDDISAGSANRLVMASARADQSAYFVSQGALSFSNQFWTRIFNGESIKDAYLAARTVIEDAFPTQNPLLDTNGNGVTNEPEDFGVLDLIGGGFIGNAIPNTGSRPALGGVSPPQTIATGNQATVDATGVMDEDGIARVYATLVPPGYVPGSSDNPIAALPSLELLQVGDTDTYSGTADAFSEIGTYQVVVYAEDLFGNVSVPLVTSVTVNSPLRRRAVIIAGGALTDPEFPAVRTNARLAYAALAQQGYGPDGSACGAPFCDDIQFLIADAITGFDATATLTNVEDAITDWGATGTQDLTVYLVAPRAGNGFRLNASEVLSAATLDGYLDIAEATNPGRVTVVVEGDLAGGFVNQLTPANSRRTLVASASATDVSVAALDGGISFSRFFWTQTLNGASVREAFSLARSGVRFADACQNPEIDADGNNIPNQLLDAVASGAYRIGNGILLAGDDPTLESAAAPDIVTEGGSYDLVVSGITTTGVIDRVVALVSGSGGCSSTTLLSDMGNGQWGGPVADVTAESPPVTVAAYAIDTDGNVSQPAVRSVAGDIVLRTGFED